MFGYIVPNYSVLDEQQSARFRAAYCGLCHVLRERHGLRGSAVLSYDMTFLAILLAALYEPEERQGMEHCPTHPIKKHAFAYSEPFAYVADMNVALAYYKCLDNWIDDHDWKALAEAKLLKRAYRKVSKSYPEKCRAIEKWLDQIREIEQNPLSAIDAPVNSTGRMLGELFAYREDHWRESLRIMGNGLGRFIYYMDAYDDLEDDIRLNRFNALKSVHEQDNYEALSKSILTMMIADCTNEFEQLPILQDADLLRNVLYSGVWSKYVQIQEKRKANDKEGKE